MEPENYKKSEKLKKIKVNKKLIRKSMDLK